MKKLKIIPLGGIGEVGNNMLLLEYEEKILIIDMGFRFPEENMPGIDYVIPNISYLKKKKENIIGGIITHGHYDHIGAIPYIMKEIGNPPLYASDLAEEIISKRQEEFSNEPKLRISEIKDGDNLSLPPFKIEFFKQNHNIPGNLGLFIETPEGNVVITSDFKFDKNPVNEKPTDFKKLKRIGERGINLLISDSTNAEKEGHSLSEGEIFENLDKIFQQAKGRIITATFSSLINRLQQMITLSEKHNRKVVVEGFSLKTNVKISQKLGYIKAKKGTLISPQKAMKLPDSQITILCTGAQGEERAVLMKIANGEHKYIRIKSKDSIVFSSSVIPGNERIVQILKDEFYRKKADVYHYEMMDIHAGGHAHQEELKKMISLMKPKFLLPYYGHFSMISAHARMGEEMGIPKKNIILAENGQIIEIDRNGYEISKKKVPSSNVMVDGLGIGDVGNVVLRDRQNLANDGMFVIIVAVDRQKGRVKGSPDIISRGFVYLNESQDLLKETRKKTLSIVNKAAGSGGAVNWSYIKDNLRDKIGDFLYTKTKRRPMILPVIIEV